MVSFHDQIENRPLWTKKVGRTIILEKKQAPLLYQRNHFRWIIRLKKEKYKITKFYSSSCVCVKIPWKFIMYKTKLVTDLAIVWFSWFSHIYCNFVFFFPIFYILLSINLSYLSDRIVVILEVVRNKTVK